MTPRTKRLSDVVTARNAADVAASLRKYGYDGPERPADVVRWLEKQPEDINTPVAEPRKKAAREHRPQQAAFRQALLRAYGGRCAVTGCDVEPALEAAHVADWQSENDPGAGILLRADRIEVLTVALGHNQFLRHRDGIEIEAFKAPVIVRGPFFAGWPVTTGAGTDTLAAYLVSTPPGGNHVPYRHPGRRAPDVAVHRSCRRPRRARGLRKPRSQSPRVHSLCGSGAGGDLLYLSDVTGTPVERDADDEALTANFVSIFEEVKAELARAGATFDHVVTVETYRLDHLKNAVLFGEVKNRYIKAPYPTWTDVGVSALAPGAVAKWRTMFIERWAADAAKVWNMASTRRSHTCVGGAPSDSVRARAASIKSGQFTA